MKPREGDLIKTISNVVFDVKGLVHPPNKIIAFPRFIPSPQGTRQGKEALYGKVYSLSDRFKYLQENQPDLIVFDPVFGETICEVPIDQISEHYQPTEKLASLRGCKNLNALRKQSVTFGNSFKGKSRNSMERNWHLWLNNGRVNKRKIRHRPISLRHRKQPQSLHCP